jgi:glycosyltransferase involved in cell wall biosynthesis
MMNSNSAFPPILCTGLPAWEGDYQKSTIQLMQALAQEQEVLYVEYPFSWKDVWQGWRQGKKPHKRILGREPRLREMPAEGRGRLHVLTLPPIFPVNGLEAGALYDFFARKNAQQAARTIVQTLEKLGYSSPILLNAFNPFLGVYLHGRLSVAGEYYYCYDQIGAARWTHRHGPRLEARYLALADGLITSSAPLLEEKKPAGKAGVVVKNGVNLSLFEQAFQANPRGGTAPVFGYLGSVDDRLDVGMLLHLLESWPEAKLLVVGRIMDQELEKQLTAHPRVELAGSQPPDSLPAWVRRMDIGLIPFVSNEFTRYIYPLKINEYLAAGLPVVSTSFGDLSDFESVIYRTETTETFAAACREAWAQDNPDLRADRRAFARGQAWEARARQLTDWLRREMTKKMDSMVHS